MILSKALVLLILVLIILEYLIPFNKTRNFKTDLINIAIAIINKAIFIILIPVNLFPFLIKQNYEIFNLSLMPWALIFTIILFDFFIYWQHRLFHISNRLFRLHRLHHTDRQLTFTSGVRFHIFELALSLILKCILIILFKPDLEDYLIYEMVLLGCSLFNHSNIKIPSALERVLRLIIITPKTHRVHHSIDTEYQQKNFGNITPIWDYIFLSYDYHSVYKYGLNSYNHVLKLGESLSDPFKRK